MFVAGQWCPVCGLRYQGYTACGKGIAFWHNGRGCSLPGGDPKMNRVEEEMRARHRGKTPDKPLQFGLGGPYWYPGM